MENKVGPVLSRSKGEEPMKTETVEPGSTPSRMLRLRGHGYSLACLSAIAYGADRWVRVGFDRLRVSEGDFKLLSGDPVFSKVS